MNSEIINPKSYTSKLKRQHTSHRTWSGWNEEKLYIIPNEGSKRSRGEKASGWFFNPYSSSHRTSYVVASQMPNDAHVDCRPVCGRSGYIKLPANAKNLSKVRESWNAKDIPFDYPLSTGVHPPAASRVCQSSERLYTFVEDWLRKNNTNPCVQTDVSNHSSISNQANTPNQRRNRAASTDLFNIQRARELRGTNIRWGDLNKIGGLYQSRDKLGKIIPVGPSPTVSQLPVKNWRKIKPNQNPEKERFPGIENSKSQQYDLFQDAKSPQPGNLTKHKKIMKRIKTDRSQQGIR